MGRRAANAIVESGSDTDTDTNDEGESSEIIGHLSQFPGSPRSPKTTQIAPRFSSQAKLESSSPKRKQSSMLLHQSPLERSSLSVSCGKSPLNLSHSMSPTLHATSSSTVSAPASTSPNSPMSRRRTTVALTNGRVRILSSPSPVSRGLVGGAHSPAEPGKVSPVGGRSPIDNSRPSFNRRHTRQNSTMSKFSSRSSYRKSSSTTVKKEEGEFTEKGFHRCSLDDGSESSDDDSFFRELDGVKKGGVKGEEVVSVVVNLASITDESNSSNKNKNNGGGGQDDVSLSTVSTSSSASSMMLDIDIVQSRLLQKQAVKAAAAEEKRKEESNKARKRKADPRTCASQAVVSLANYQLGDDWVEKFARLMGPRVRKIDLSNSNISKLGVNALFRSILPSLKGLTLKQVDLSQR